MSFSTPSRHWGAGLGGGGLECARPLLSPFPLSELPPLPLSDSSRPRRARPLQEERDPRSEIRSHRDHLSAAGQAWSGLVPSDAGGPGEPAGTMRVAVWVSCGRVRLCPGPSTAEERPGIHPLPPGTHVPSPSLGRVSHCLVWRPPCQPLSSSHGVM